MKARRQLSGLTIGFIGAGTMGQALMRGLLACGVNRRRLAAADPHSETRRRAAALGVSMSRDNAAVVKRADVLVLAVKPQQFSEIVAELAPQVRRDQLVISIAAGIRLPWLQARLRGVPVIRVMPNLPATVGEGFSAIALGRAATARHAEIAEAIFGAAGCVQRLPERDFDAMTAVSGSGPAYVFFLAHAWQEAARALGLPPAVAEQAIRQTLRGSLALLERSGQAPEALIGQVASKGGTTEAALNVLAKRRVAACLVEALRAAAARSKELSWSSSKS